MSANPSTPSSSLRISRIAATILLTIIVLLVCLIPKAENDLFFELRTGMDILRTGHLPHIDTYSWTNRGTRWDVPEWLAFVLYTLAFKAGGFLGTWLLMALLTVGAVWVVWFWLAPRVGMSWAFPLANLTLLAMKDCIQERPYAFSYLLLAVTLAHLTRLRQSGALADAGSSWRRLLWLPAICALWANLHQGVLVLICLLLAYALADAIVGIRRRAREPEEAVANLRGARRMLALAVACAIAAMASPYGWRIYWNVLVTLRDHNLMANVTEWNPVTVLPFAQLEPFFFVSAILFGALVFSRYRDFADTLAIAALFVESLLHARNIALFAVGGMVIAAPHLASCVQRIHGSLNFAPRSLSRTLLLSFGALIYTALVACVAAASIKDREGAKGYGPAGIGEAVARVPSYPEDACAFMDREGFPANLRMLNNFEIGGYLMWRRPGQPVFVDGRLDVYVGRTFDDMLVLARPDGSPAWERAAAHYDFDCVVTTSLRQARPFLADPNWTLVYLDPKRPYHMRCRILLRRRPQFAALIERCRRAEPRLALGAAPPQSSLVRY
ncbi:hypothetical protein CCAX7_000790 [Capsulimonas corticalis]|uniref:Uncharacterized protein n=1 Tax=Capsulimonas corticalis TaxID=2219043 RepID=A0A9N7KZE2_9BACT|nr:hypothetical protein [Capsulimonas corticalis]BDI28028.1 hypothetical protein CCAX7_000790 [Capsulimonas corticalis]